MSLNFFAMRKVILWIGMSLDGFTADQADGLDWLVPHAVTPGGQATYAGLRAHADTVLLGRVNYQGFQGYWPPVQNDPKASPEDRELSRWLDAVPKVVFSRTLKEVTWKNARLARGSTQDELTKLRAEPGKDIIIQNSTRLARSLLSEGQVDELVLLVAPVVIGSGRSLFAGLPRLELRQVDLKRFDDGAFVARYEVKKTGQAQRPAPPR
jgi:dihydrofolate reductase